MFLATRQYSFEPLPEERCLGQAFITDAVIHIAGRVHGTRAELLSEENVRDTGLSERRAKRITIELRVHSAERLRTHVSDGCYAVLHQQLDEPLDLVVGVPYGGYRPLHVPPALDPSLAQAWRDTPSADSLL
jgi:hypothetical protein